MSRFASILIRHSLFAHLSFSTGRCRIRTCEGISHQIYSLTRLTASVTSRANSVLMLLGRVVHNQCAATQHFPSGQAHGTFKYRSKTDRNESQALVHLARWPHRAADHALARACVCRPLCLESRRTACMAAKAANYQARKTKRLLRASGGT